MVPEMLFPSTLLTSGMIRLAVRKICNKVSEKPPDSIINVEVQVAPLPDHKIISPLLIQSQFNSV
jgi:hypothetical protein